MNTTEAMRESAADSKYQWRERRWFTSGAPAGKCWTVRQMFSYSTRLASFIPHLQAMAEGLEIPYFSECDEPWDDDGDGIFVVGLRPLTDADRTEAQLRAERQEQDEREQLERLLLKYGQAVGGGTEIDD